MDKFENSNYDNYRLFMSNALIYNYKEVAMDMLHRNFPLLTEAELEGAVNYAISKSIHDSKASIENNYTKQKVDMSLLNISDYIITKKPIITSYGMMFKHHGSTPNPIFDLIDGFIKNRKKIKKEMFKYPKGSEMFSRYFMSQLLEKLNANGFYGVIGQYSSIYYNLNIAATVTRCGRSANSAASLFFESFLDDNVPFGSINEMTQFIYNVLKEPRTFKDWEILKTPIDISDCFAKLMYDSGFGWIPSLEEMDMIWDILCTCTQEDINRLYYKNNLYRFIEDSPAALETIIYCLKSLNAPFMDPNDPPEEIKEPLTAFYDLLFEYVYYKEQIIDRLDKMESLVRNVSIIQDTDSSIVCLDGWYRFILNYCRGIPMPIKVKNVNLEDYLVEKEVKGNPINDTISDYDFEHDEIVERDRLIDPMVFIPQDGLRYSIINILSYCVTLLANDYMYRYTKNSNSDSDYGCFLVLKNEFLFKRILVALEAKKHYASIVELQEGNVIPDEMDKKLDFKGFEVFVKTSIAAEVREKMKRILYEDILNPQYIDQIKVIKDMAIAEKDIRDSILRGEKKFYKPVKIKSVSGYQRPMSIQGIKASYAYNSLHQNGTEAIDLNKRNAVDIVKCFIHPTNVDRIKEEFPDVYEKACVLMQNDIFKHGIDAIAVPLNEDVPKWILPFVKYDIIVNDAVSLFPLESIGIYRATGYNNYSNMIQI